MLASLKDHPCPIHPNWVDSSEALYDSTRFARYISTRFARSRVSQIDFRHDESTQEKRFVSIRSNRLESTTFSTTLYRPREVKIREITIHEPSSFLKLGHKLQSIRTIRVDSVESTTFSTHPQSPDQLYFLIVNSRSIGITRTSISVTGTGL